MFVFLIFPSRRYTTIKEPHDAKQLALVMYVSYKITIIPFVCYIYIFVDRFIISLDQHI